MIRSAPAMAALLTPSFLLSRSTKKQGILQSAGLGPASHGRSSSPYFFRAPEQAPAHGLVPVEHQGVAAPAGRDWPLLERLVARRSPGRLAGRVVEGHAPTSSPNAVVLLDDSREVGPRTGPADSRTENLVTGPLANPFDWALFRRRRSPRRWRRLHPYNPTVSWPAHGGG